MIEQAAFVPDDIFLVMGIDENGFDQVVKVFRTIDKALDFCKESMRDTYYLDTWIERHELN